jgi:hypothetical protein
MLAFKSKSTLIVAVKALLCGLIYVIATMIMGVLGATLHLGIPNLSPAGVSQSAAVLAFFFASLLLGLALTPLARGIGGTRFERTLAFSFFIFVCMGLNATIEILTFTTMLTPLTAPPFILSCIFPALAFGAGLSFLAPRDDAKAPTASQRLVTFFSAQSPAAWLWRIPAAILAFPLAYFVFGAMVAPIVVPTYRAGVAGLVLPPLSIIMPVQLVRSTLFLLASLPFLILWKGKRGSLIFSLGLAHWLTVGIFGLLQAHQLSTTVRIAHSLEIGADSFAYAALLVLLLSARPATKHVNAPIAVQMFPS